MFSLEKMPPPPHFYCRGLAFLHIPTGGKSFQVLNPLPTCYPFLFLFRGGRKCPCPSLLSSQPLLSAPNPGRQADR